MRRWLVVLSFALAVQGAPSARAGVVGVGVRDLYPHVVQVVPQDGAASITLGRDGDGSVVVGTDGEVTTGEPCALADAATTAHCPADITTAVVGLPNFDPPIKLVVRDGSALAVAVFAGAGDDDLDLRGATVGQVSCGAGLDTVLSASAWVWDNCEQLNGGPHQPREILGSVRGDELDAAPGGIAWIDRGGGLHLRTDLTRRGRTLRPPKGAEFRRLDVGLDAQGRAVATVAECRGRLGCARWLSVDIRTGRRSALRVLPPPGCAADWVARWRTRTVLGVRCGPSSRTSVVVLSKGRVRRRIGFPSLGAAVAPAVDIRGDLVGATFNLDNETLTDLLWAWRLGPHPCGARIDAAGAGERGDNVAGRLRIVAGGRLLWSFENAPTPSTPQAYANLITFSARCKRTSQRYILQDPYSDAMTLVGSRLISAGKGQLASQALTTVPAGLWPVVAPWFWAT